MLILFRRTYDETGYVCLIWSTYHRQPLMHIYLHKRPARN